MRVGIVIPFRDRGTDPLRMKNLNRVMAEWSLLPSTAPSMWGIDRNCILQVSNDGRPADAQFNRSAAYNRAVRGDPDADVFIFAEADMLIAFDQIYEALVMAAEKPGLVVPFTTYNYMSASASDTVRENRYWPGNLIPERVRRGGTSIGAINVVSRETLALIGQWDEAFDGNAYDDDSMRIAFESCAGPTRWVEGPAYHLYHLPANEGEHLTSQDRSATRRNHERYLQYEKAAKIPDLQARTKRIRQLTAGAKP